MVIFTFYFHCLDIDECVSFPCGSAKDNCTNFPGFYECTVCGQGLLQDAKGKGECVGM